MSSREDRKKYVKDNIDQFAIYTARYRDRIKIELVAAYGGCCSKCGESDPIVLTIDHVNNDALDEMIELGWKKRRCGHMYYVKLKREGWPQKGYQLLCHNCNVRKEYHRRRVELEERRGIVNLSNAIPLSAEDLGL